MRDFQAAFTWDCNTKRKPSASAGVTPGSAKRPKILVKAPAISRAIISEHEGRWPAHSECFCEQAQVTPVRSEVSGSLPDRTPEDVPARQVGKQAHVALTLNIRSYVCQPLALLQTTDVMAEPVSPVTAAR